MKKAIITTIVTTVLSLATITPIFAGTTVAECTLISVAYQEGVLILNIADSKGNLYQYEETENFYFDKPATCTVTFTGNTITKVEFE